MPTKRAIPAELSADELGAGVEFYELEVDDRRVNTHLSDALAKPRKARLDAVLERLPRNHLPQRVEAWCTQVGVAMPPIIVSDQQKRWGSCDRSGTIRLNWRIIQAPMRLVDYVVVHELVHLRHRGHDREYWQALGRVMPDYERRREDLMQRGTSLTW